MPAPVATSLPPLLIPASTRPPVPGQADSGFSQAIGAAIANVERTDHAAKTATADLLIGGTGEIHEVALAAQRAELTLELFQQVRNKLVQAYQEVMRMPM